jgi:predicted metal-dependent phosphoesterase TrpH
MKRFWIGLSLFGLATATSLASPSPASWTPARIGDHWILEGDVHVHTSFAGALSTPFDIPLLAKKKQLDFVAITEHNAWFGGWVTKVSSTQLAPEVIVLPSEELTNRAYHLLAIGLEHRVDPTAPLSAIADDVHHQGGIVIAAHPTRSTWPLLHGLASEKNLDGAELFHPTIFWREERAREYAEFLEEASRRSDKQLTPFGSSDFHGGSRLGVCRTIVFARERTSASVMEALREGRVVAATPDGRMAGDPKLVESLRAVSYRSRAAENAADADYSKPGGGAATHRPPWSVRIAGWAMLVLLLAIVLRRPVARARGETS